MKKRKRGKPGGAGADLSKHWGIYHGKRVGKRGEGLRKGNRVTRGRKSSKPKKRDTSREERGGGRTVIGKVCKQKVARGYWGNKKLRENSAEKR